ncbi:MAG: M81 family metallopeptidase [Thalassobaculales bacterium]
MARIAIGGFQHETNTFAPSPATYEEFARGGGWPGLLRGGEIFDAVAGINLPIAGFIEAARESRHELWPTAWAAASPSAEVTEDAYERIAGMILDGLAAGGRYDAVYLCLHGAMVAAHLEDGEGELIRRVRKVVGEHVPIVASLDLHANTTPEMVKGAQAMVAYRTYPHIDMAATGRRAARHLDGILRGSGAVRPHFRQIPFLIPLNFQCTMMEPAQGLYEMLEDLERGGDVTLSFTPGFPAADIHHCGAAVFGYGADPDRVRKAVDALADAVEKVEGAFAGRLWQPAEAVAEGLRIARRAGRPVVLADTQDNPGAGGNSDTTGLLRAMVAADAPKAALGLIADGEAAAIAHQAGVGAEITIPLGGRSAIPGDEPFHAPFVVEWIGDGRVNCTGPFYKGARMTLGPMATLRIRDVRVVVASRKCQMADQEMYRVAGIEPTAMNLLGNKSSVHFRADFAPIAADILVVESPGPMIADPAKLAWQRLRRGIRLSPLGPVR